MKSNNKPITEFEYQVLDAFDRATMPMATVYMLCARLGNRQSGSKSKFYVKVYRALEKLVDKDVVWVMRGTRDPSVYMAKRTAKGFDSKGIQDIPF